MQLINSGADESLKPLFSIEMTLQSQDFHSEWQRCSMLANYIAEYMAYQFPERDRAENFISTVTNELLETIAYLTPGKSSLSIRCSQFTDTIKLDAEFSIRSGVVDPYMDFMQNYRKNGNHYLELLTGEVSAEENFNQLGLAMLAHDFNIEIDTHLDDSKSYIRTQVIVPVEEFLI